MPGSVLTPLDGSSYGELALPFAAEIASGADKNLHLLHVHVLDPRTQRLHFPSPRPVELPPGVRFERRSRRRDRMARTLDRFLRTRRAYLDGTVSRYGLDVRSTATVLAEGCGVPETIRNHAQSLGSDLIVMSTRSRTGLDRLWLGSVSDAVVRATDIPVLLIRPPVEPERVRRLRDVGRVLVPLDRTPLGERVLDPVVNLGVRLGWEILLLHVVPTRVQVGARTYPLKAGDIEERSREASEYLESVAGRLRARGATTSTRVEVADSPSGGILRVSHDSDMDLVAMATHGRGGVRRAVLGSVADAVIGGTSLPVLVAGPGPPVEPMN